MKKLTFIGSLLLSFTAGALSQPDQLIIEGATGKFYINHSVNPSENWYSIGRLYNVSPKELAPFNNLGLDKGLSIGEELRIPLTKANFTQTIQKSPDETLVPLYHLIQEKEWFYHISQVYDKVPMESLEKWNHMKKEQARAGMALIVGFLRVKTALSSLARKAASAPAPDNVHKEETPPPPAIQVKSETRAEKPAPAEQTVKSLNTYSASHAPGGYFRADYAEGSKSMTGDAGTFKSTSGWQDGKYYALLNNVPVGTIIKITSSITNRSVYAKVLGQLPEMKESTGLTVRISNAASAELGTSEGRFPVALFY
jgi:hypothetical protein